MNTFGFIGCGNMGGTLALAVSQGVSSPIAVSDYDRDRAAQMAMASGGVAMSNEQIAAGCRYIFLGVKPQVLGSVLAGIAPVLAENGIWLAAQCCEHLNRAIILEREAAGKYGWEEVCVVPRPHAGGSWATTCWKQFRDPIAVEEIRAHAGIDIGGTLIGMHLRRVAVPVRLSLSKIGEANILCARTRPKLIGGERAKYTEED